MCVCVLCVCVMCACTVCVSVLCVCVMCACVYRDHAADMLFDDQLSEDSTIPISLLEALMKVRSTYYNPAHTQSYIQYQHVYI